MYFYIKNTREKIKRQKEDTTIIRGIMEVKGVVEQGKRDDIAEMVDVMDDTPCERSFCSLHSQNE